MVSLSVTWSMRYVTPWPELAVVAAESAATIARTSSADRIGSLMK